MTPVSQSDITSCVRCGNGLTNRAYELQRNGVRSPHCFRCAVQFGPMLKRSLIVCLIVGTILAAINQGNFLLSGDLQSAMIWKIPMTYAVPFIVATVGGLMNARSTVSVATDASR